MTNYIQIFPLLVLLMCFGCNESKQSPSVSNNQKENIDSYEKVEHLIKIDKLIIKVSYCTRVSKVLDEIVYGVSMFPDADNKNTRKMTVKINDIEVNLPDTHFQDLYNLSQHEMYAVKNGGKCRVTIFGGLVGNTYTVSFIFLNGVYIEREITREIGTNPPKLLIDKKQATK